MDNAFQSMSSAGSLNMQHILARAGRSEASPSMVGREQFLKMFRTISAFKYNVGCWSLKLCIGQLHSQIRMTMLADLVSTWHCLVKAADRIYRLLDALVANYGGLHHHHHHLRQ